jgi:hypothetical protein
MPTLALHHDIIFKNVECYYKNHIKPEEMIVSTIGHLWPYWQYREQQPSNVVAVDVFWLSSTWIDAAIFTVVLQGPKSTC